MFSMKTQAILSKKTNTMVMTRLFFLSMKKEVRLDNMEPNIIDYVY